MKFGGRIEGPSRVLTSRPKNRRRGAWLLREKAENNLREKHSPVAGCLSLVRCPTVLRLPPPDGGARDLSQVHSPFALISTRYFARIQPLVGPRDSEMPARPPSDTFALASEPKITRFRFTEAQRSSSEIRSNAALRIYTVFAITGPEPVIC